MKTEKRDITDVQRYNQAYMQLVAFVEQVIMKMQNWILSKTIQGKFHTKKF